MDIRRAEIEALVDGSEELVDDRTEVLSPSGKYKLVIRTYQRPPDMAFSRGTIYRVADGAEGADIKRNHPGFHHSFVTKAGRELLIAGHSFLSQIVVDLDDQVAIEPPGDHFDPESFCWARALLSPDGTTLVVDGCYLGRPYEYRFFDFTDPRAGWPALPVIGVDVIEAVDGRAPAWLGDATFECFQMRPDRSGELEVAVRTRLQRDGDRMVLVERHEADDHAVVDAWWHTFITSDPMYLAMQAAIRDHQLPAAGGIPAERRIVRYFRRASPQASADLIWDLDAQIAVRTYDAAGGRRGQVVFPHNVDGMIAAIAAIAAVFDQKN